MALYIIIISTLCLIFGILMLGYTTGEIKYIHWLAILAILVGIVTLQKEINSAANAASVKRTVEDTKKTSDEVLANITGGNSYCYLEFFEHQHKVKVHLQHVGDYSIKGLKIYVTDASFSLDKQDKYYRSPSEGTIEHSTIFFKEEIGIGYNGLLTSLPMPLSESLYFWVITFETADGRKKWYQRVEFRPLLSLPNMDRMPPSEYAHRYSYQVYKQSIETIPTEYKIGNETRVGNSRYRFTQEVLRECQSAGPKFEVDWKKYFHLGYNESGDFDKVIYLEGAKDCSQRALAYPSKNK